MLLAMDEHNIEILNDQPIEISNDYPDGMHLVDSEKVEFNTKQEALDIKRLWRKRKK